MPKQKKPKFKRILLKLSGESLLGTLPYGIDFASARSIVFEIKEVYDLGVQIAIMIGGGNIFRGASGTEIGMERASADYMGMLATVMNGIALQDAFEREGVSTRQISAFEVKAVAEPFLRRRVINHLENGRIIIFTAGIGRPFFTTDTAAAERALEINAEIILKATKVDGVYSTDPIKDKNAKRYTSIKYLDVLRQGLKVMDATAISLCQDYKLPILVFNLRRKGNIKRAVLGDKIGTLIY